MKKSCDKWEGFSRNNIIRVIAISMSLYHLAYGIYPIIPAYIFRPIHLMFAMILIFLLYPFSKGVPKETFSIMNIIFIILALTIGIYFLFTFRELIWRQGNLYFSDIAIGIIAVILVLEITRRTTGLALVIVSSLGISYCYLGKYCPGILRHVGFNTERIIGQMYTTTSEGIYGMPIGTMARYVFLFILFGAFLKESGAGDFFVNLALAIVGRLKGGPAHAAVISSFLMGSISGSAIANVVSTGTITIPIMKKVNFKPHEAAAVETAASTGGVLTPPVMGSGAFIMSSWTGVPYSEIIKIALLPALLYYASVAFFVQISTSKNKNIEFLASEQVPNFKNTLKMGGHLIVPIVLLVYILLIGYSPIKAATVGILSLIPISMLRKETRLNGRKILHALEIGARNSITVSAAMACSGLIIASLGITGLGIKFSSLLLSLARGNLCILIIFVGIASLFLGMGLPLTASYIVLASVAASALQIAGLSVMAAHMIILWFSQDASVTPPVCITSYVAAGIADANPVKTDLTAWKVAKGLYVLPFLIAYTPTIDGTLIEKATTFAFSLIAFYAIVACLERYFLKKISILTNFLLFFSSIMMFVPYLSSQIVGLIIFCGIIIYFYRKIHLFRGFF